MKQSIRNDILTYVEEHFGTKPEYLWISTPNAAVLRHTDNAKWYGLIMDIPYSRLGVSNDAIVDVLNVKCDPLMVGALLMNDGYYPAYHMNKEHWISILLDGSVSIDDIYRLINESFELTIG